MHTETQQETLSKAHNSKGRDEERWCECEYAATQNHVRSDSHTRKEGSGQEDKCIGRQMKESGRQVSRRVEEREGDKRMEVREGDKRIEMREGNKKIEERKGGQEDRTEGRGFERQTE